MQENSKKRQHKTRICKKSFIDLNKKRCDVTRDRHNDLIWFIIKSTVHAHAIIINKYTTHCEMFEIIIGTDVLVNKRFHLCGLGVLFGGSLPNFNFFNVNPQIFQRNRKVHLRNCLETNFHNIPNISFRVMTDVGITDNARF